MISFQASERNENEREQRKSSFRGTQSRLEVFVSMATGVCVLLSVCVGVCVALNLDTLFPVVKTGGDGTLFGLSVALHQDLQTQQYLLLVGAPRERAEPDVPANRTGGVYSCPITVNQSQCSRVKLIDPEPLPEDLVEDMWLGVSVASQGRPGGRILACGHRFVKLYGALRLRHMIGRCYLRGNDLQHNITDLHWQDIQQPCSHLGDVSSEVMCNAGLSAVFTQTEVLLGSPGSYEWEGNVHVIWMNPEVVFDTRRSSLPNLQHRNIYTGYSVTQARHLLSQDDETVVAGAPRDRKEDARGSVVLAVKQGGRLVRQQTLRGGQMGSYFGNAVATVDLNNDGWRDLLVGAPFYFQQQQEAGGAVYVYMNVGGRFEERPSLVLTGPLASGLGMALAAAGDLDQDGFQDFAAGAPFCDTGSVMIWNGGSNGVSTKPSQVIRGRSVSPLFRTFGYSLSGGVDVDGNQYPDLLVGSLDNTVALLRTRPVLHLSKTLRVSPDLVDLDRCDFCIQVEVCFSYSFSTGEKSSKDNITVLFTVSADVTSLKPRLRFHDNGQSVYSAYLSMPKKRCETLKVGPQGPIQHKLEPLVFSLNVSLHEKLPKKRNSVQDLKHFPMLSQTPQQIRTQIHIQKSCGSDNVCHSNLQMTARFLDQDQRPFPRRDGRQVLLYDGSVQRLYLQVNISNLASSVRAAEDAHNVALNISVAEPLIYSGVRTKGDVPAAVDCSVEDRALLCELGNPFRSNQTVQVLIIFQPSQINLDSREIQSLVQLSTLSEQSDLPELLVSMLVEFSLQASVSLIQRPGPASFGGHVMGESAMETTADIGDSLLFVLQVHVSGTPLGRLGDLQLEFDWPLETWSGKWLLYLTEIQVNGTSESQCVPPGNIVNPLNLPLSKEEKKRRRRSLEDELLLEEKHMDRSLPVLQLPGQKKSYTLDCMQGARCVTFSCPLINMKSLATLSVRCRLWSSTMIEEFSRAREVLVRGRVTLKLQSNKPAVKMEPHTAEMEVLVYPALQQPLLSSTPLWILVVAVLAGVLLLALLCLLLWKCGFFVRQGAWQAELHQGRIVDKGLNPQRTNVEDFLIQETVSTSCRKQWITSWRDRNQN